MKKRIAALLVLLCLLAALIPSGSAAGIYFVAMNDTVPLTLSTDIAPFFLDGILLAPVNAFGVSGLGISSSYQAESQILTMQRGNAKLIFDFQNSTVQDQSGTQRGITCSLRGGAAFVPVAFTASHFGFYVSLQASRENYQVLRFTNGTQVYDDALFMEKAETLIGYRVQQHEEAQNTPKPQQPDPPAPPKPQQPVKPTETQKPQKPEEQPAPEEEPEEEPEQEQDGPVVYLAIAGTEAASANLTALRREQVPAVFFLTAEDIRNHPEKVLAICAAGYPIGLAADAGAADVAAALQDANAALDEVIWSKTLFAMVRGSQLDAAEGYFTVSLDRAVSAQEAAEAKKQTRLVVCTGSCADEITVLTEANAQFRQLRETTKF